MSNATVDLNAVLHEGTTFVPLLDAGKHTVLTVDQQTQTVTARREGAAGTVTLEYSDIALVYTGGKFTPVNR